MTSNRFFVRRDHICPDSECVCLEGAEHHHLSRVARVKPRSRVRLFDEAGGTYLALVERIEADRTCLCILERQSSPVPKGGPRVVLALALLKAKAWEWVLQKGTELGVDGFVPVMAARSVAKVPRGAVDGKMERWKRIVLEASKQCGTPRVPDISDPTTLASLLRDGPTAGKSTRRLFLEEGARTRLRDLALIRSRESDTADADPDEIQILAGPEGGWTNVETRDILEHGFEAVSLGELILRAETAAICSLAIVTQFWE